MHKYSAQPLRVGGGKADGRRAERKGREDGRRGEVLFSKLVTSRPDPK